MGKIIQLSEVVANMIAAGEVVESPLSVVKELVENSIDAGATNISINLLESGIRRIEVVDNGCGMSEEDALMAFNRHATSKIKTSYDLACINTLGFRGEALPSIASVSLLELYTNDLSSTGIKVTYKAGKLVSKESAACNKGCRIIVSNLFYNTPARLKYLKSPNVIFAQISDLIDKLALTNDKIRFTLSNNNQLVFSSNGKSDYLSLFGTIYGIEIARRIRHSFFSNDFIKLDLYFALPDITRSRKNDITISVNGRYVKSTLIVNAVCDAFKNYIPQLRYPICFIRIDIDSLLIDVNVHPQKMDIKFSDESLVYDTLKEALVAGIKANQDVSEVVPDYTNKVIDSYKQLKFDEVNLEKDVNYQEISNKNNNIGESLNDSLNDNIEKIAYHEKSQNENNEDNNSLIKENKDNSMFKEEKDSIVESKDKIPYLEYIGQFAGTYLLFQNEEGLYLIDQHAAQERINYEYYYEKMSHPNCASMDLIVPLSLRFTKQESLILADHLEELKKYGFVLESSSLDSFFIRSVPNWIKQDRVEDVVEKILYFLLEKNVFDISLIRDSLAKQIACKASIKANHYISKEDAIYLINELKKCKNPFNCPHGRPSIIKLTTYEIEKMFKRVM